MTITNERILKKYPTSLYQKRYKEKHPWAKHYYYSKSRAKRKGLKHNLGVWEFHQLWLRDEAYLLKSPSIDRIDNLLGYIYYNCRFIEKRLNTSIGNKGRKQSKEHIKNRLRSRYGK